MLNFVNLMLVTAVFESLSYVKFHHVSVKYHGSDYYQILLCLLCDLATLTIEFWRFFGFHEVSDLYAARRA